MTTNNFKGLSALLKQKYSTKPLNLAAPGHATAALDASKDPMKALKDKSYLSLKGKKGVAV